MLGEVDLFGGGGIDAPEVGGLPGEERGGKPSAAILDGDTGADWPGRDEFSVAGDEAVGGGGAFLPERFASEGIGAVDEAIVRAKPGFFINDGGWETNGGIGEMEPLLVAGFGIETMNGVVG